jgi:hypothetical protein
MIGKGAGDGRNVIACLFSFHLTYFSQENMQWYHGVFRAGNKP